MAGYNTTDRRRVTPSTTSPVKTKAAVVRNHQGGESHEFKRKSQLFLLAVSNFGNEKSFYEDAHQLNSRFCVLVRELAVEHPKWTARFLRWLRTEANMRTSSIVGAANYAYAWYSASNRTGYGSAPTSRQVIDSVILRADEPGELLGYWHETFGRTVPSSVKRGLGDAVIRLGTEFNYLKWDSESRGFRMRDIINLVHPGDRKGARQHLKGDKQAELFEHIVYSSYDKDYPLSDELEMLTRRAVLMDMPVNERRKILQSPEVLRAAGMTWESLAGWLQGPMDRVAWEAIIPSMGYMALLRNLRNFDEAGVSDKIAQRVAARLADPEEVARSKQFPMRMLSAYRAAPSLRWAFALENALTHSLANVPQLSGNTLILVDTSGSMGYGFSDNGKVTRMDAAALFGIAMATACESATVVSFSNESKVFPLRKAESVLKAHQRFHDGYFYCGGTNTTSAVRKHFDADNTTRVVILTDEQHHYSSPDDVVPADIPLYTWNLGGYRFGSAAGTQKRYTFGGLTDAGLRQIPLLEASQNGTWPF